MCNDGGGIDTASCKVATAELIEQLQLARHPEGGWYRETYRAAETIPAGALPERFGGNRPFCTSILFLLPKGDVSSLHRIKSDELWHHHAGAALTIHTIAEDGSYRTIDLGTDPASETPFQAVVPRGCWFGAEVTGEGEYALVGCTVAPGFDFNDFELAERETLLQEYPSHRNVIMRLTRKG